MRIIAILAVHCRRGLGRQDGQAEEETFRKSNLDDLRGRVTDIAGNATEDLGKRAEDIADRTASATHYPGEEPAKNDHGNADRDHRPRGARDRGRGPGRRLSRKRRSESFASQFGPEYERTVQLAASPRAAEQ